MPAWLVELLVNLALKVGIPFLVEKFNWIPVEFWRVVQDLLSHVNDHPNKQEAIQNVRAQLECIGVGCAPKPKGL